MLPKTLIKGLDKRRLRILLALFFLALAVPTAVLIWQAYGQLKWEAFHQHRGAAEELTRRVDARLNEMVRAADARSFADYAFLVVSGDPSANFVQRSPLSAYPVVEDLPGAMGYFQVDAEGIFSTPLLPSSGAEAASVGIGEDEFADRLQLAQEIHAVLADNRLVQARPGPVALHQFGTSFALDDEQTIVDEKDIERRAYSAYRDRQASAQEAAEAEMSAKPSEENAGPQAAYSQQVFDQLNQPRRDASLASADVGTLVPDDDSVTTPSAQRGNRIGKVSDLKLDAALQKKSAAAEGDADKKEAGGDGFAGAPDRAKRREKIALPESPPVTENEAITNLRESTDLRISTFESEIDPFEFSLLDSGHLVLFRKVWRDEQRYIQGLLVDRDAFVQEVIGAGFMDTALAAMSSLIIAFQDDVISTFSGRDSFTYPNLAEGLDGALLYRSRLTAPLNNLELIYSIRRLPPGAGASVLGWVTLVLALVFVSGFAVLYRLAASQINLARQQQDFVSAVSHELKTPLTSIRMYGEMLKEGWADEEKRQSYYEYIHDESERLSRLISNVLELARITRNEPQFDLKPVAVGELMANIQSKIANQVERAGFELRLRHGEDVDQAIVNIDEDCFAQIIINLVDNAMKFSTNADDKIVEIGSRLTGDKQVLVSVRDYGPGIPKDQMQKIFELFYRSESELTRETVGTGIGLAIVHQLTLAMNGSVDMVNVEPGAEFRLLFPAVKSR